MIRPDTLQGVALSELAVAWNIGLLNYNYCRTSTILYTEIHLHINNKNKTEKVLEGLNIFNSCSMKHPKGDNIIV